MKARNFRYVRPASLQEAYRMLAEAGGEAVPIAGGQSLLAGLNMRLSSPKVLVDIGNLAELTGQSYADGMIRLGALTRHRDLLSSAIVRAHLPLLAEAAPHIGHIAIRNRGTIGGSLAYADPAAELPACAVALGATLVLGSAKGERQVKAEDFFKGLFETDLRAGELIVEVKFPEVPTGTSTGFAELSRRHGDFALVGVAALAILRAGEIESARIVYFGCVDRARVAASVSAALSGAAVPLEDASPYAAAIRNDVKPDDTPGLRADTKLHMATVLTRRALNSMVEQRTAWAMSS
ncbi:MAG TPA: xanthine dehydrogenase family protein subunit M [Burkholderiales bacterium]|jgi:carbon-monoxide dehydrogenase medium subunit|nr:xanthine dehydrogenase family protein subunit M [Burkholderiales bacterium]